MSLQEFWQDLSEHYIHDNVLTLDGSSLTSAPDVNDAIHTFYLSAANGPLVMQITNDPTPANVLEIQGTIQGTLFGQQNPQATAIFSVGANNILELTLKVSVTSADAQWTLAAVFTSFAGTGLGNLCFASPAFVLVSDQADSSHRYSSLTLSHGWNFCGSLQLSSPPLQTAGWLLPNTSSLSMAGSLTLGTGDPDIQLATPASASLLRFGSVSLTVQINAQAQHLQGQNGSTLSTSITLLANFNLGSGAGAPLLAVATPLRGDEGFLMLRLSASSTVSTTFAALAALLSKGMSFSALIPSRFALSDTVVLSDMVIALDTSAKQVVSLSLTVGLQDVQWAIVPDRVTLTNITVQFRVPKPLSPSLDQLMARASGALQIGTPPNSGTLNVLLDLRQLTVQGYMLQPVGKGLNLLTVLGQFFGSAPDPGTSLTLRYLGFVAAPAAGTYMFSAAIEQSWSIPLGTPPLTISPLTMSIVHSPTALNAEISGVAHFLNNDFSLVAGVRSIRQADGTSRTQWVFAATLMSGNVITVQNVADSFLPVEWRKLLDSVTGLSIPRLSVTLYTNPYAYTFAASLHWSLRLGSQTFALDADFSLASSPSYNGFIEAQLTFNNLVLLVGYRFGANSNQLYFQFQQISGIYDSATSTLRLGFGDQTIGQILSFLINLAAPGRRIDLPAPWNQLTSLTLRSLSVEIDFNQRSIGVDYALNANLGFATIQSLGIVYTREYGQSQVRLTFSGDFLGQRYDENNRLSWDVLNEAPPITPGAGVQLIDIQYLGLGQHISLQPAATTLTSALTQMQNAIVPARDAARNPLAQATGLAFNSASSWLIGAKFVIMSSFSVGLVFNDPQLYGLVVSVNGPKAGAFQGLSFEILYRKISDTTGVFHIDLRLPATVRQIELGAVSVTLPTAKIDLYTDGGFRLDFGFPPDQRNFSNSFALQVFPFTGFGGFYLAYLRGDSSTSVPQISNGSFSPIVELGLALSIGLGKSIDKGCFHARLTVTVTGMLQGVLAWFNPEVSSTPSATYFWVQGMIAIVGQVEGAVEFGPVRAKVAVSAYAAMALLIEAFQPIVIRLEAGVEANASVKIGWWTKHFSFSTTISESFTIGQARPTPWRIVPGSPLPSRRVALLARAILPERARLARMRATLADEPQTTITPLPLELYLVPSFSQASQANWLAGNGQSAPTGGDPFVSANLLLLIQNSIDPQALTAEQVRAYDPSRAGKPFDQMVYRLIQWLASAFEGESETLSAAQLDDLAANLADPAFITANFGYEQVADFCAQRFIFVVLPRDPESASNRDGDGSDAGGGSGTIFPMPPELTLTSQCQPPDGLSVDFSSFRPIDAQYAAKIDAYFAALSTQFANGVELDPDSTGGQVSAKASTPAASESMAQYLFRSYWLTLARAAVQAARELLAAYPYWVTSAATTSLNDIANDMPSGALGYITALGDTPTYLAGHFQISLAVLQSANQSVGMSDPDAVLAAGTPLIIPVSVTPASIVAANQSADLLNAGQNNQTPVALPIDGLTYQVRARDTINAVAKLLGVSVGDLLSQNQGDPGLLQIGATVDIGTVSYTMRDGDSVASLISYFGVTAQDLSPAQPVSGQIVQIGNVKHVVAKSFTVAYTAASGDTLDTIVQRYFPGADPDTQAQQQALIRSLNPNLNFDQALTARTLVTFPYAQTFGNLAVYYLDRTLDDLLADSKAANASLLQGTNLDNPALLAPLAMLACPPISYTIQPGNTFASIAAHFNLSLDDLARSIADTDNLFRQSTPPIQLVLPNAPAATLSDLDMLLSSTGAYNNLAAMVSRFLLHGLQLPDPADPDFAALTLDQISQPASLASIKTYPLYLLVGQAMQAQAIDSGGYAWLLNKNDPDLAWLSFAEAASSLALTLDSQDRDTITGLDMAQPDPSDVSYGALPLYAYLPERYTLQAARAWQAAVPPAFTTAGMAQSAAQVAQPTLWPLPDSLLAAIASAQEDAQRIYQVMVATQPLPDRPADVRLAPRALWATSVDITIQHLPRSAGAPPGTYLLLGADDQGKQRLYDLWSYLASPDTDPSEQATISLLYAADPSANSLASDALDGARTFLLKVNLSTLSHSAASAAGEMKREATEVAPPEDYGATFEPANSQYVLKLLWEASVVRSGGFYLEYVQSGGAAGLPSQLFDSSGNATLTVLVVLQTQSRDGMIPLRPFNNLVTLLDPIDMAHSSVFAQPPTHLVALDGSDTLPSIAQASGITGLAAQDVAVANQDMLGVLLLGTILTTGDTTHTIAADDTLAGIAQAASISVAELAEQNESVSMLRPGALIQFAPGQLRMQATARPGTVGFWLTRPNPLTDASATLSPADQLANLFSLLAYRIVENDTLNAANVGVPLSPARSTQDNSDGLQSLAPTSDDTWQYRQLVTVYPFAKNPSAGVLSSSPALPPAAANPYAGVAPAATANLDLHFRDLYGADGQVASLGVSAPVRFFDNLIGLGQWPNTMAAYDFGVVGGEPQLSFTGQLKPDPYLLTLDADPATIRDRARADLGQFQQIYYQWAQLYAPLELQTSLGSLSAVEGGADLGWVSAQALLKLVASTCCFLSTVQQLSLLAVSPDASQRLADLATGYCVSIAALAEANRDQLLSKCFSSAALAVPQYVAFPAGGTLNMIVGGDTTLLTKVAENNQNVPLHVGAVLATPDFTYVTNSARNQSLVDIASAQHTTVEELGARNAQIPLSASLTLVFEDLRQTVPAASSSTDASNGPTTLAAMAQAFQAALSARGDMLSVSAANVAVANQLVANLFANNQILTFGRYVAQPGDTLASVAAGAELEGPSALLTLNYNASDASQSTPDLWDAGTTLRIGELAYAAQPDDTFQSVADRFYLPVGDLWAYGTNPNLQFKQGAAALLVPGHVGAIPDGYMAYDLSGAESFAQLTGDNGWSLEDLADLNHDLTGIFKLQSLSLNESGSTQPEVIHTVAPSDTLDSLALAFSLQPLALLQQLLERTDVLRPGGMLLAPAPRTQPGETLDQLAARHNYAVADIATANAAVPSWLAAGQTLTHHVVLPDGAQGPAQSYTTQANDTLLTIVSQFSDPALTVGMLVAENGTLLVDSTQPWTLVAPPRAASIAATVTLELAEPIVPISVSLVARRDSTYVDDAFQGAQAVLTAATSIVPHAQADAQGVEALQPFAASFEQAFPGFKLAVGPEADDGQNSQATGQKLWGVRFGQQTGSLSFGAQGAGASFYAIKPLYTLPWNGSVAVRSYTHADGLQTDTADTQFTGVDLEAWTRTVLRAVDTVLTPQYATPLFRLPATRASLQKIVYAKSRLADALAASVDSLFGLNSIALSGGFIDQARQALADQALVELSSAYQTDVLVQLPFEVASPYTDRGTAPRLSGKPRVGQYTFGAADTLDTLAERYPVGTAYLALALQDVQHILNQGTQVSYNGLAPYTIAHGAVTLRDIATANSVDAATLAGGLQVLNDAPLFKPGAVLNITLIEYALQAGEGFSDIAENLGVSIPELLLANQNTSDVFALDSTIMLNNQSIAVTPGYRLSDLASQLNISLTPDLAMALWQCELQPGGPSSCYTFNTNTVVYGLALVPAHSLSSGRLPLANGTSPTTFLFSLREPRQQPWVSLDLDFEVNELEYAIQPAVDGYSESSWLSFVLPLEDAALGSRTSIGQLRIPIPLRGFPQSPVLIGQSALPTAADPINKQWTYRLQLNEHDLAAQDSIHLHLGFNIAAGASFSESSSAPPAPDDVAAALAQLIAVYPAVQRDLDLALNADITSAEDLAALQHAADAFASLVSTFAEAWASYAGAAPAEPAMESPASFEMHQYQLAARSSPADLGRLAYLRLTPDSAQETLWPAIIDMDANAALPVLAQTTGASLYQYQRPASQPLNLAFEFGAIGIGAAASDHIDIIRQQNGWGGACVRRNAQLIPQLATNSAFIYRTPLSLFPNQVTPLLQSASFTALNPDVADGTQNTASLVAALSMFFQQLSAPLPDQSTGITTVHISVAARCGFPIAGPVDQLSSANLATALDSGLIDGQSLIMTYVPLVLYLYEPFDLASDWQDQQGSFVNRLAAAVTQTSAALVPDLQGIYVFDITVYSTVDESTSLPILEWRNLYFNSLFVIPDRLPASAVGRQVNIQLVGSGGSAPYSYSIPDQLPPGLTLDLTAGTLAGTPTIAGDYTFSVMVADSNGSQRTGRRTYRWQVGFALAPGTMLGRVGVPFEGSFEATGSAGPWIFDVAGGQLPPGLTLDQSSGAITGTPSMPGSFGLAVQARDTGTGLSSAQRSVITIVPPASA